MVADSSFAALARSVRRIAAAVGALVIVALPAAVGYSGYSSLHGMMGFRADQAAGRVAEYAYVQGKTWRFSDGRIAELVDFAFPDPDLSAHLLVTAAVGSTVVEMGAPVPFPALRVTSPVIVLGERQGAVAIDVSLRPLAWLMATVFLLGLVPGALAFFSARSLPQRALHAAIVDHAEVQRAVDAATAELKTKAVELEQALAKEQELSLLQRQFVTMASHEFRTPLAIIDGAARGLKRRMDRLTQEQVTERIDRIRSAVKRMTRLMESTLTAARMEEGKIAIKVDACDVGQVVRQTCERQSDIAPTHTIGCDLVDLPETVQADSAALEQVLTNLLSNAVKYSPQSTEITVVARGEGDQVVISVSDRGRGIDEEDLPRMFERFFRAKTSTGTAGTGIGLNLALMLVKMHDGSIAVASRKGEGSTFTVRLPVAGPQQTAQPHSQAA